MIKAKGARPARQKRSQQTRDELLEALARLLRKRDFTDIGVAELAAAAGVSPGAIYRRFEGGLTEVLIELARARIDARVREADASINGLSSANLREALRAAARSVWRQATENAHIFRAAYVHARLRTALVKARPDLEERSLAGFRAMLENFRSSVKRSDFDRAVMTVAMLYNTAFLERALFPDRLPAWSKKIDAETYAVEIAELAYSYLSTSDAGGDHGRKSR